MTKMRWQLKPKTDPETTRKLQSELGVFAPLAELLVQRGHDTFEKARSFFRPDLKGLHDPFLMKDMDRAVARLEQALGDGERIMVYGDYDVDGTTSVAMMVSFLQNFTENLEYYIPDRYEEGYGVSEKGIHEAAKNKVELIITLDCGIRAVDKVQLAKELGIDMIICDHHRPEDQLPAAVAVLDPKRPDCNYPCDELSGCGVGFKLAQGFAQQNDVSFDRLEPLLDLVAISIGCDIVPITGENRILAFHGLKRCNEHPRVGIKAMLSLADVKRKLTITDLVFQIGPRINAAGRIEHGKMAVDLLLSEDEKRAEAASKVLHENNAHRRELDKDITEQALEMIAQSQELQKAKTTVVFRDGWHKGVVGIVASRLIETHYKPTIVLTGVDGKATGSARSVRGFDVHDAISECSDLLEKFGGHKYAAGLTMDVADIEAFRRRFDAVVSRTITEEQLTPQVNIDLELDLNDITPSFHRIIGQMAPFGPQNMKPVFLLKGVQDTGWAKVVGDNHLKMTIKQEGCSERFGAIAFRQGEALAIIQNDQKFDLACTIEENAWNGNVSLQLNVKAIRKGS